MITIPGVHPWVMWSAFVALVIFFLIIDLIVVHKKEHIISLKEALIWTAVWFSLAMIFDGFLWWEFGHDVGLKFLTGYLIEKSLSVDNLFVMLLIFTSFKIAPKFQHRVLFWGILGALVMRGLLIWLGTALISKFEWILYIFGAFLIYAGFKMFFKKDEEFDPHDSFIVRMIRKVMHVSKKRDVHHFFVRENSRWGITILFVSLLVIEATDVTFAFDSIPAIFAITTDPFIVFTSNVFAILGLRSLYFVIARAHDIFHYLNVGLAIVLSFVGLKLLLSHFIHISILPSLGVVIAVIGLSIVASIVHAKHRK